MHVLYLLTLPVLRDVCLDKSQYGFKIYHTLLVKFNTFIDIDYIVIKNEYLYENI